MPKPARTDDESLSISADHFRESVPWKLRYDGQDDDLFASALEAVTRTPDFTLEDVEALPAKIDARMVELDLREALTSVQIEDIASRFSLPLAEVAKLSTDLAIALNPTHAPNHIQLPRSLAVERAQKAMHETITELEAGAHRMTRGIERLDGLDTTQARDREGADRFITLREDYDRALREVESLHRKLRFLADTPDVALDLRPADKRTVTDQRRTIVLTCLFEFWSRAGRNLSVTTDPYDNARRKGQLVEFVNTVVRCITEPSRELSGDTILDELTLCKRRSNGT